MKVSWCLAFFLNCTALLIVCVSSSQSHLQNTVFAHFGVLVHYKKAILIITGTAMVTRLSKNRTFSQGVLDHRENQSQECTITVIIALIYADAPVSENSKS